MAQHSNPDPRTAEPRPPFKGRSQPSPGRSAVLDPEPDYGESSYQGLGRLEGRVALVTGGDSGIGRAIALAFAREGADVAISYLEEDDDAQESKRLVEDAGRRALLLRGDVGDPEHDRKIVERTVKELGHLEVLVNNAGWQGPDAEKFEEIDPARLERTFKSNILSMFHLVRAALPHLQPGATIINTASIQAYQPKPGILDYATTKGAIVTFTKGLAQELIQRGIRVNAVAPGPVWTPLVSISFDDAHLREFGKGSPMGRPAQPIELAPPYVFLASDESRYVNGEILGVTGGQILA